MQEFLCNEDSNRVQALQNYQEVIDNGQFPSGDFYKDYKTPNYDAGVPHEQYAHKRQRSIDNYGGGDDLKHQYFRYE